MVPEISDLVLACVIIMAILVVLQALVMSFVLATTLRRLRSLHQCLTLTSRQLQRMGRLAHTNLDRMISLLTNISQLKEEISEQSWVTETSVRKAEDRVSHALTSLREDIRRIGSDMDSVLTRLSNETFRVHHAIIKPAQRASALIHTFRLLLKRWSGQTSTVTTYTSDEETFI